MAFVDSDQLNHADRALPPSVWIGPEPSLVAHLNEMDQFLFHLYGWGPEAKPHHQYLHEAFLTQVSRDPDALAIDYQGELTTYGELNDRANQIAAELADHGVGRNDMVGLFAERSTALVASMLGVLKLGAAYVPQHAGVAPERQLQTIVDVTNMKVVLTRHHLRDQVPNFDGVAVLDMDEVGSERPTGEPPIVVDRSPEDPCFVLFTSGTTGPPNGVAVTHANVANIVFTEPGNLGIKPGMRVGQILSIAFDMAEWEIYGALGHGATLVIRGKSIVETAERVDVLISTPSVLASIDSTRCHSVKAVAVAGEPCPRSLADEWSAFAAFHNSCGPTETTIVNTVKPYRGPNDTLSIGTPTPNNTVYVLDENLRPLPIGEIGEMWAGGDCVTAGYINNPDLNADRYRDDPFIGQGRKMFRTRDLGRWNEAGELEHFGRTDDQVKIRGFRVELDSVSAVLESVPECTRAVTLKYDSRNLIAFVEPATVDPDTARKAIADTLPYYCMPIEIHVLDKLPRTDRGKIDKTTLKAEYIPSPANGALTASSGTSKEG